MSNNNIRLHTYYVYMHNQQHVACVGCLTRKLVPLSTCCVHCMSFGCCSKLSVLELSIIIHVAEVTTVKQLL